MSGRIEPLPARVKRELVQRLVPAEFPAGLYAGFCARRDMQSLPGQPQWLLFRRWQRRPRNASVAREVEPEGKESSNFGFR